MAVTTIQKNVGTMVATVTSSITNTLTVMKNILNGLEMVFAMYGEETKTL